MTDPRDDDAARCNALEQAERDERHRLRLTLMEERARLEERLSELDHQIAELGQAPPTCNAERIAGVCVVHPQGCKREGE